eukprot:56794-Eustigmatos_ZCMA.PRE.3
MPLRSDITPEQLSAFWDQARLYKDRGLSWTTAWKLLIDNQQHHHAYELTPGAIYQKLKREVYAKVCQARMMRHTHRHT